ncbi:hypothetical protein [Chondromyces apiculatus]|uniref:Uncharacterized protein n=1 Tax=Chondromyces apiculatus DSM 436 TaxID=1192034 RepID=A0A017SZ51_9BACT|nr:hypothetical protein [Chondromyces apiculatus]EYF01895.1 Hypothetical protein CAP_7663 [Chondromyces apiculatus DSM 436]
MISSATRKLLVGAVAPIVVGEVAKPLLSLVGQGAKSLIAKVRGDSTTPEVGGLIAPVREGIEDTTRAIARGVGLPVPERGGGGRRGGKSAARGRPAGKGHYKCNCETAGHPEGEGAHAEVGDAEAEAGTWVPGPVPFIPGGKKRGKPWAVKVAEKARRAGVAKQREQAQAEARLAETEKRLQEAISRASAEQKAALERQLVATRSLRGNLGRLQRAQVKSLATREGSYLEKVISQLVELVKPAQPMPGMMVPGMGMPGMMPWMMPGMPGMPGVMPGMAAPLAPAPAAPASIDPTPPEESEAEDEDEEDDQDLDVNDAIDQIAAQSMIAGVDAEGDLLDASVVAGALDDDEDETGDFDDEDETGDFDDDETGDFDDDDETGAVCGTCVGS